MSDKVKVDRLTEANIKKAFHLSDEVDLSFNTTYSNYEARRLLFIEEITVLVNTNNNENKEEDEDES